MTLQNPGAPLVPYHTDEKGDLAPGTGSRNPIKPYVRFDLKELKDVPAHATVAWVLLLRQWHATKKEWVTIPKRIRQEAGVSAQKISRNLETLETSGFVELRKGKGQSTMVRKSRWG